MADIRISGRQLNEFHFQYLKYWYRHAIRKKENINKDKNKNKNKLKMMKNKLRREEKE